jgi:hypothetical protein
VTELLQREGLSQLFAPLETCNLLSASPESCGNPIAPGRNTVWRRDCDSTYFAATRENQREPHVDLADEADRQERSGDAALREDFIITGISEPFKLMQRISNSSCGNRPSCRAGRRGILYKASGFASQSEQRLFLTNKLSFNLLQDRLACVSQPSLEGVIVTNLVVNFPEKPKQN